MRKKNNFTKIWRGYNFFKSKINNAKAPGFCWRFKEVGLRGIYEIFLPKFLPNFIDFSVTAGDVALTSHHRSWPWSNIVCGLGYGLGDYTKCWCFRGVRTVWRWRRWFITARNLLKIVWNERKFYLFGSIFLSFYIHAKMTHAYTPLFNIAQDILFRWCVWLFQAYNSMWQSFEWLFYGFLSYHIEEKKLQPAYLSQLDKHSVPADYDGCLSFFSNLSSTRNKMHLFRMAQFLMHWEITGDYKDY